MWKARDYGSTVTVVVAERDPPAAVVHESRKFDVAVSGDVEAMPFTLVLSLFASVKNGSSALDIVHDFMPLVTQPSVAADPDFTFFGFATRMIDGFATCTAHCAPAVALPCAHVIPYVAVFEPAGKAEMTVVVEPESSPLVENPVPVLSVESVHANEMASVIPTSSNCG